MDLKGIVSVSGKSGLYKLIGQNKAGFILESLDAQKLKLVVNLSQSKMASLDDITIYGDSEDIHLSEVFKAMRNESELPEPKTAASDQLRSFFRTVAPEHDEDRVYSSDIKKIITWFNILKELPLFDQEPEIEEKK